MSKKILVTGGAGYIGSTLVPMLLDAGHEVRVIDIFMYEMNSLAACAHNPRFSVHNVDIRDVEALFPHIVWAEVVIPLAALVGAPICNKKPYDALTTNLHGQTKLLQLMRRDQRVIMPITESVYGSNENICTEETPTHPLSTYGQHKVAVEKVLLAKSKATSLRLATVFGFSPSMRLDLLINDFTWRALHDRAMVIFEGHYRRTSVHVRDVARAFIHALDNDLFGVYNVGAVHCTKVELCEAIRKHLPHFSWSETTNVPKDTMGKDPDQRNYQVSDAKIRSTGFAPEVTLDEGIAELLRAYPTLRDRKYSYV